MRKSPPPTPSTNTAENRQDEASRDVVVEENTKTKQDEDQQNLADLVSAELAARGITEPSLADLVRAEMATHGITEQDVADAIKWARSFKDNDE